MRTRTGLNLIIMLLGGYLDCDVRVDTEEKTEKKERKKRKERRNEDKAFSLAGTNGSNRG